MPPGTKSPSLRPLRFAPPWLLTQVTALLVPGTPSVAPLPLSVLFSSAETGSLSTSSLTAHRASETISSPILSRLSLVPSGV